MTCFEQHREHLAPQLGSLDALEQLQLTGAGLFFVLLIALLEGAAIQVVQI